MNAQAKKPYMASPTHDGLTCDEYRAKAQEKDLPGLEGVLEEPMFFPCGHSMRYFISPRPTLERGPDGELEVCYEAEDVPELLPEAKKLHQNILQDILRRVPQDLLPELEKCIEGAPYRCMPIDIIDYMALVLTEHLGARYMGEKGYPEVIEKTLVTLLNHKGISEPLRKALCNVTFDTTSELGEYLQARKKTGTSIESFYEDFARVTAGPGLFRWSLRSSVIPKAISWKRVLTWEEIFERLKGV